MKIITYTNNQGLELKVNKFTSGQFKWAFSLTFNNGVHTFCYTLTELRTFLLKNGMTRKWAANVKDRFDPITDEHVLINRYRTSGGSEMGGVFTSLRALANSRGATRINIEGEYESYTETDLKDIAVSGQTFIYFGEKCRIYARPLNI